MTEILGHLPIKTQAGRILQSSICILCMIPFIMSQFLRREQGNGLQVVPSRSRSVAFIGQLCELPEDVMSTVGCSIRSAHAAGYELLGLEGQPPGRYEGKLNSCIPPQGPQALHDLDA